MGKSGAILREVGATSNFKMTGFTSRPELRELIELGRERGIPVYEDLGRGCLVDLGLEEPLAQTRLSEGANLVSFSGDKMPGGPQGGLLRPLRIL